MAAHVPGTLGFHDLRHTNATHANLAGESLFVAGKPKRANSSPNRPDQMSGPQIVILWLTDVGLPAGLFEIEWVVLAEKRKLIYSADQ